jgi:hypothetical protein
VFAGRWDVFRREAVAIAVAAQEEGLMQLSKSRGELYESPVRTIGGAREATRVLLDQGLIPRHS